MESIHRMESSHFCSPQMVCLIKHHIPEALFFRAWSMAVPLTVELSNSLDALSVLRHRQQMSYSRGTLWPLNEPREKFGFQQGRWSYTELCTGLNSLWGKILVKIHIQDAWCKSSSVMWDRVISLCLVKVPSHDIWIRLKNSNVPSFGQISKRGAFVAVRPETAIPTVNPKRIFLSFHVKLYWKRSMDEQRLNAQRSNIIL